MKKGVSLEKLDEIAKKESDNECAASMQKAKQKLFEGIKINRQKLQFSTTRLAYVSGSYVD